MLRIVKPELKRKSVRELILCTPEFKEYANTYESESIRKQIRVNGLRLNFTKANDNKTFDCLDTPLQWGDILSIGKHKLAFTKQSEIMLSGSFNSRDFYALSEKLEIKEA